MHNLKVLALAAVGCVFAAASLQAQITGEARWLGHGPGAGYFSNNSSGPATFGREPISPYWESFKIPSPPSGALLMPFGTSTFGPTVDVYCIGFTHPAYDTDYNAYFTNLGQNPGWVGTYTRSHTLQQYLEVAYLAQQLTLNPANAIAINGAIWNIMDNTGTWATGSPMYYYDGSNWVSDQSWITQAAANYSTVDPSRWVVVTPFDAVGQTLTGHQEFLAEVVIPEPATLLLLGTGLVVMLVGTGAVRRLTA